MQQIHETSWVQQTHETSSAISILPWLIVIGQQEQYNRPNNGRKKTAFWRVRFIPLCVLVVFILVKLL